MRIRSCRRQREWGSRRRAEPSNLPPEVRPAECEGPNDPLADAGGDELWRVCGERKQEAIAMAFADRQADDVRDCLLEATDAPPTGAPHTRQTDLGSAIWKRWISFRDRALADLYRRGRLIDR